ncbi:hypothetical protein GCM10027346_41870 [Hymenobacter seoulensis]
MPGLGVFLSLSDLDTDHLSFLLTPTEGIVHEQGTVLPEARFTVPARMTLTRLSF